MKKSQIALLGGQIIPVYWGIKERAPDNVHLIYTEELKEKHKILETHFNSTRFTYHLVNPYDFDEISLKIESLVFENESENWELNLTGGTKVMTLAAHNVFKDLGLESFYLDQKNQFFFFKQRIFQSIKGDIKINTFLSLSGHSKIKTTSFSSIDKIEFDLAFKMLDLMKDTGFRRLFSKIASTVQDYSKPYSINLNNAGKVEWKNNILKITTPNISEVIINKKALQICFSGLWWELIIAKTAHNWKDKKEMLLSVEMLANIDHRIAKNEIDIILNTGKTMIFIECKSGNVRQEDVNKMRAVKRLYGGISSKSILVCFKLPRKAILEKCNDLGIEIFAIQKSSENKKRPGVVPLSSISTLNRKLSQLVSTVEV